MDRVLGLGAVLLLLAAPALVVGAAAGGDVAGGGPDADVAGSVPDADVANEEFDRTEFRIQVTPDADARWTFRFERVLRDDEETADFEAFAAEFTDGEHELATEFRNQAEALVESSDEAVDREMRAEAFDRDARIESELLNDIGIIELHFTWTNFARETDDELAVDDVFRGGLYVGPDQALIITRPDGWTFTSIEPEGRLSGDTVADSQSVTWPGEHRFLENEPRVRFAPAGEGTAPGTDGDGVDDPGDEQPGGTGATPDAGWLFGVGLVGVLTAIAAAAYWRRRAPAAESNEVGATTGSVDPDTQGEGSTAAAASPARSPEAAAVDDVELLSDDDRVKALLAEHEGRMKQTRIVEETGWSKSKVSMLLSEMEDAGEISKLRVGRENIISLPGKEPDAARSPFEDVD